MSPNPGGLRCYCFRFLVASRCSWPRWECTEFSLFRLRNERRNLAFGSRWARRDDRSQRSCFARARAWCRLGLAWAWRGFSPSARSSADCFTGSRLPTRWLWLSPRRRWSSLRSSPASSQRGEQRGSIPSWRFARNSSTEPWAPGSKRRTLICGRAVAAKKRKRRTISGRSGMTRRAPSELSPTSFGKSLGPLERRHIPCLVSARLRKRCETIAGLIDAVSGCRSPACRRFWDARRRSSPASRLLPQPHFSPTAERRLTAEQFLLRIRIGETDQSGRAAEEPNGEQ